MNMNRRRLCALAGLAWSAAALILPAFAADPPAADPEVTLELIMSDPDWIGRAPTRVYWADDSQSFYYSQKREGEQTSDLHHADLTGAFDVLVEDKDRGAVDSASGQYNADRTKKIFSRNDDLFLKDISTGKLHQLTRTAASERRPLFLVDDANIAYQRGGAIIVRNLTTGLEYQPADLRLEQDPAKAKEKKQKKDDKNYLVKQQYRLFDVIREQEERRDAAQDRARARRAADPTRAPTPFYLGSKDRITTSSLSPSGDWMLVALSRSKPDRGKADSVPHWVTQSGYIEPQRARSKVGTGSDDPVRLLLLDLTNHKQHKLDLSILPGIADDPLADLKAAKDKANKNNTDDDSTSADQDDTTNPDASADTDSDEIDADAKNDTQNKADTKKKKKAKPRPISLVNYEWSNDGKRLALMLRSADNKDRWVATVNVVENAAAADDAHAADDDAPALRTIEHLHDDAWINWRFNNFGWLHHRAAPHDVPHDVLWFLSERDGYSHLYTADDDTEPTQLTTGAYEVSNVVPSPDGQYLYFTANKPHPGQHELYRVPTVGGDLQQLTIITGDNSFTLSPDQTKVLIRHSETTIPPDIYIQPLAPNTDPPAPRQLTHTISDKFKSIHWTKPDIVAIPSTHTNQPIYSRLYTPAENSDSTGDPRPAILFVHGAGYLQNSHKGWSGYFHEFMFHTLLTRLGYVVLDMDYRASAGYGRDWRTAIYRNMGTPELQDLEDGINYIVANQNVDPNRVGIYGGSYGGFMTLMGLFQRPDLFACGAALRPVTDWAHYNHGYTSNILNIPKIDPDAYANSSPIEFAAGLEDPLLICHGMVDDNVFFEDTVRLAQRLIELEKQNWEIALFPVERHGFTRPSSWLNEYRRILKLFETNLK